MKDWSSWVANTLWQAVSMPAWHRFQRATNDLEVIQNKILGQYLESNQNTEYGRRYDFESIKTVEEFQDKVPLTTYDDYTDYIESIVQGQSMVLTAEPVLMFEITSGSTSGSKLIPYTQTLKSEFTRAISPWIVDLFRYEKGVKKGGAYWSITPLVEGKKYTSAGIPIGFEEDSAYFGRWGKILVDSAMSVPNAVKLIEDIKTFRYITLLFLLRRPDLRLISIWNPTFLTLLLDRLPVYWNDLIVDIAEGTITSPGTLDQRVKDILLKQMPPDPQRSDTLRSLHPEDFRFLWPDLRLISCWTDASAAPSSKRLQEIFPDVSIQGKGLIATEGFISLPIIGVVGSVLACTSHFFEFQPIDPQTFNPSDEGPKLAHQLEEDQTYSVIVTTGGGLYRYQMHDIVQVVDYLNQTPCFRFLGKGDKVSDWFGEKLTEQFVSAILSDLMMENKVTPNFAMLAPDEDSNVLRYTLFIELPHHQKKLDIRPGLSLGLERKLRLNFHYDYCRKLGQLGEAGLFVINQGASETYLQACKNQGQRLGNIKPSALQNTTGWSKVFNK